MKGEEVLKEEVIKYEQHLRSFGVLKLNESFVLIDALNSINDVLYDENNSLSQENWEFIKDTLNKLSEQEDFTNFSKEILCKLYCLKIFTKISLGFSESLEDDLRYQTKEYISKLRVSSGEEFLKVLKSLPFEYTSQLIRWNANFLNKKKKEKLSPKLDTANKYLEFLYEKKNQLFVRINKISRGEEFVIPISDIQSLLDVRAFMDDNEINQGTLEFILRTLTTTKSKQKLIDLFGEDFVERLRQQVLLTPCYIKFVNDVFQEKTVPFFTEIGLQNTTRPKSYNQYVTELLMPELYIPETPQETPLNEPMPPQEGTENQGEEEGQESGEPGQPEAEQPSGEELV